MLPALQLIPDGRVLTESDDIILALEAVYGPLTASFEDATVLPLRRLERGVFRAWCDWLCRAKSATEDAVAAAKFNAAAEAVSGALSDSRGPFFLGDSLSVVDVLFAPFLERMRASLYYFKAYDLCAAFPRIRSWFAAMEVLPCYAGFMADFHTHAHDLPPQLGGCVASGDLTAVAAFASRVDRGPWDAVPEVCSPPPAGLL